MKDAADPGGGGGAPSLCCPVLEKDAEVGEVMTLLLLLSSPLGSVPGLK